MRGKGVRLWLRPAYNRNPSVWVIKDGRRQISTGCAPHDREEAERKLAEYITASHVVEKRPASEAKSVLVADVLNLYLKDIAPKHARPDETSRRILNVAKYFGGKTLESVNGPACRDYAKGRPAQAARRELEDFRAALNHYFADDLVGVKMNIVLPEKGPAKEIWMDRSQAAKLLMTAWRKNAIIPKSRVKRYYTRHIARFILVGLYTGTRAAAICSAAIRPTTGRGYVDLDRGVFYRRPPGSKQTTKRQPYIRLPPRLLAHMRRWARLGLCQNSIVEWEGQPVKRVNKAFKGIAVAAGLPQVTPHTLRHTAITWAMQNGADPVQARGFFGLTEKVMNNVYLHHHPDHQADVIAAIERRPK